MRLRLPARDRTNHATACRLCLGSGRVPYVDNHFDLWMVPCHACSPRPAAAGQR